MKIVGHIRYMLIIGSTKKEYTDADICNLFIIEITILVGGHIENMLIIEIPTIEFTDGHIAFMLIKEISKIE